MVVDSLRAFRKSHPDIDVSITEIGMPSVEEDDAALPESHGPLSRRCPTTSGRDSADA